MEVDKSKLVDVVDYEGNYKIHKETLVVYSVKYINDYDFIIKGIKSFFRDKNGSRYSSLSINGKAKKNGLELIIRKSLFGEEEGKIIFKDGDKDNLHISNIGFIGRAVSVGKRFDSNTGVFEVVEYRHAHDIDVLFEDGTKITGVQANDIKKGDVRNPNFRYFYGVGFKGQGVYNSANSPKAYTAWRHLLRRCYDREQQKKQPTYIGVKVHEDWHSFQVFAEWYENNEVKNWVLDKDILSGEDKIYGPYTCCFVPVEINSMLTNRKAERGDCPLGVNKYGDRFISKVCEYGKPRHLGLYDTMEEAFKAYKEAKETQIKAVADKWKGRIDDRVYRSLYEFEVHITD